MKKSIVLAGCFYLLACGIADAPLSFAQTAADQQAILGQARQAYYSLHREGLLSFQCALTPNWETVLQDVRKQNPAGADNAIKILSQLHFMVNLGADGGAKITHNDLSGQSKEMMDALAQVYGGMQQMTSGFFDTWSFYMLYSPLPKLKSTYQLHVIGSQYQLAYRDGDADVVTTMGKDFAISDLKTTTQKFDSVIQPRFAGTPEGFVLNAYHATYQSQKPEEATQLEVLIRYQQVEGLQLPQTVDLSGTYGATNFVSQLAFSNCQVTRRTSSLK